MFEDSLFESSGRIDPRRRKWLLAATAVNSSVLLLLMLVPLLYPEALPRQIAVLLLQAPAVPELPKPVEESRAAVAPAETEIKGGQLVAPTQIPPRIKYVSRPEAPPVEGVPGWEQAGIVPSMGEIFVEHQRPAIHATQAPVRVSSTLVAGLLQHKTVPSYPAVAKAMGLQGTVVLQATISKAGTIENLRAVSGPALLQQAAIDAVREWVYRPYVLNGEPVAVDTTVNVVFALGR